mmetsp:Transcript_10294/g.32771  ORF Transcript_10294/g.32771 Transcript_10294/m.32771 type:complete len:307 (+) Transcript_10294:64-984(+)
MFSSLARNAAPSNLCVDQLAGMARLAIWQRELLWAAVALFGDEPGVRCAICCDRARMDDSDTMLCDRSIVLMTQLQRTISINREQPRSVTRFPANSRFTNALLHLSDSAITSAAASLSRLLHSRRRRRRWPNVRAMPINPAPRSVMIVALKSSSSTTWFVEMSRAIARMVSSSKALSDRSMERRASLGLTSIAPTNSLPPVVVKSLCRRFSRCKPAFFASASPRSPRPPSPISLCAILSDLSVPLSPRTQARPPAPSSASTLWSRLSVSSFWHLKTLLGSNRRSWLSCKSSSRMVDAWSPSPARRS